jgi:hypothetical protein
MQKIFFRQLKKCDDDGNVDWIFKDGGRLLKACPKISSRKVIQEIKIRRTGITIINLKQMSGLQA